MKFIKPFITITAIIVITAGGFFLFDKKISIRPGGIIRQDQDQTLAQVEVLPENDRKTSHLPTPETVKAIYYTGWSGGTRSKIDQAIKMKSDGLINAVVIDVKDFSGTISYDTDVAEAEKYGAEEKRIRDIASTVKKLRENGIYTIARITVFQDPILAKARPQLAVHDKIKLQTYPMDSKSASWRTVWLDNKKLAWIDPSSKEAWDYNIAIAKDASAKGFDELNFDYIRFPSDGPISNMVFPNWDGVSSKPDVIKSFFEYLRKNLEGEVISADVFGLTTTAKDDMKIGQVIENAYLNFDYIAPMVYPSHYPKNFNGIKNPAEHPYEIIEYAMAGAKNKLDALAQNSSSTPNIRLGKLRPWLQDFDLGATYTTEMVKAQIKATQDALKNDYVGFMMWSPRNVYNEEALK